MASLQRQAALQKAGWCMRVPELLLCCQLSGTDILQSLREHAQADLGLMRSFEKGLIENGHLA